MAIFSDLMHMHKQIDFPTLNVQISCIRISICERNYKGSLNIFVYKNPVASKTNFEGLQKIHS